MNQQGQDINEIIKILEKFNFKFFGRNESGAYLVIAPNGQIVPVDVAYKFLQTQMSNANQSTTSTGTEGMPSMPQMPQVPVNFEQPKYENIPNNIDKQNENRIENKQESGLMMPSGSVPRVAPKVVIKEEKSQQIGDGYTVFNDVNLNALSDPNNQQKLLNFIEKNRKQTTNKDPKKWLAFLFKKFLEEYNLETGKK
jgi:hypothetical protein